MKRVKIREPIWKDRSIGVAEYHFDNYEGITEILEIEITYKNKQGERIYLAVYILSWDQASRYPVQTVKGTRLRIIPINELKEK